MIIRLHFSRQKVKQGKPWSLHTYLGCSHASTVQFKVETWTREYPKRKSNPRYFIECRGQLSWSGTAVTVVPEKESK